MISKDEIIDFIQATELFQGLTRKKIEELAVQVEPISLESGEILIKQGEMGDCLYFVLSGRLRASESVPESEKISILGEMGHGDVIGELALLTHEARAATVTAIRDSVVLKLSKQSFEAFAEKNPKQLMPIVRAAILRLREGNKRVRNKIVTIAIAPAANNKSHKEFARIIAKELSNVAPTLHLDVNIIEEIFPDVFSGKNVKDDNTALINWLSDQELDYNYVVYETDNDYTPWTRCCIRQADQVLLVAHDRDVNILDNIEMEIFSHTKKTRKNIDLVLLHSASIIYPSDTHEWLKVRKISQFHHLRENFSKDTQRLVRYLTGRSVGLVLGGGGARGFVHIGVYKALTELGFEIDFFGGSSFGGLLACLFAMEKTPETIMELFRVNMLNKKGFFGMTAPLVSLNTGKSLTEVLKLGFSEPVYLEDLWKKYFCIICNLSRGEMQVQETGVTWRAMRATVSLPAIFPPITNEKNELLIDGGVSNNLPVDVMRRFVSGGTVIASHVQTNSMLQAEIPDGVLSGWKLVLNHFLRKEGHFPNIAELILRSIGVTSVSQEKMMMSDADYYIDIDARKFKLLDFNAMDQLVELGYRVTMEKMAGEKYKG